LSIISKAVPYALVKLVLYVMGCGQNTVGVCSVWTSVGYHEERCWREWPTKWNRYFKQNHNSAEPFNDSTWIAKLLSLTDFLHILNHLNTSMLEKIN